MCTFLVSLIESHLIIRTQRGCSSAGPTQSASLRPDTRLRRAYFPNSYVTGLEDKIDELEAILARVRY